MGYTASAWVGKWEDVICIVMTPTNCVRYRAKYVRPCCESLGLV